MKKMTKNANNKTSTIRLSLKAFLEIVKASPKETIIYTISKNLTSIFGIIEIYVFGLFLDSVADYIFSVDEFELNNFFSSEVFRYFVYLMGIFLINRFFQKLKTYLEYILYDLFYFQFMNQSIKKISDLNLQDIEKREIKDLLTRVPNFSMGTLWDSFLRLTDFAYQLIRFVSSAYVILTQMSVLGLVVVFFVLPEALFRYWYNVRVKKYVDSSTDKYKYFRYLYQQSCSPALITENFPELRVDNIFSFFKRSFYKAGKEYYQGYNNLRFKRWRHEFFWSWFDGSLTKIVQLALIPISIAKGYTIGTFKYLYDYIDNLYNASWNVAWQSLMLKKNSLYLKDYFDFFEYQGFGDITSGDEKLDKVEIPKLEFLNVDFQYPDSDSAALENISFEIKPGEKIIFIGHDNSGKSTIAKLLCGLYKVEPGDILINDISIKNLDRGELKDKISVVFENYIKYNFSIRKNIVLTQPERDFNRRLYEEALEITGLDKWLREEDIDDSQVVGRLFGSGKDLSTGHWQRLAIARAIYRDRQILVLDESLTQIDGFSRKPILEGIIKHRPKQTLIYITQEEDYKGIFDKAIYIKNGKIQKIEDYGNTEKSNPNKNNSKNGKSK